jgi:predicted nucleotidyltransferase
VQQTLLGPLVYEQLKAACDWPDEQRDALVLAIRQRYGTGVCAILLYGSYLRGKRDTLLDFYVLLEDYAAMQSRWQAALAWVLPPNVYQVQCGQPAGETRAKYAVMTLGHFGHAMRHDFHSYFWARFIQPSSLL